VNFYKHNIGDYGKKTAHLSLAEHGAYLLMLQTYYATEKPLPIGKALYRLLRAESKIERAAVDAITAQFWRVTDAGLTNARADEEIERASHQRTINRELGKLGGRPKVTESVNESVNEREPNRNPPKTPDSRLQTTECLRSSSVGNLLPSESSTAPDGLKTREDRRRAVATAVATIGRLPG